MNNQQARTTWTIRADGTARSFWTHFLPRWASRLLLAASSTGFGVLIRTPNSDIPIPVKAVLIVLSIVVFVVALAYEIMSTKVRDKEKDGLQDRLEESKVEGARQFATRVNGLLTEQIEVSDGGWTRNEAAAYIRTVVKTTSDMIGVEKCRACLFEYNTINDDKQEGEDPELRPLDVGYALNTTTRTFRSDTEYGKAAIALTQNQGAVLVEDVKDSPDFAVDPDIKGYETFVAVSVHWRGSELGMLTVDAPASGQLTDHHKEITMLLARWVAVGLYHREKSTIGQEQQARLIETSWESEPGFVPENGESSQQPQPEGDSKPPWA
ncbi:GAF domain-containing protein [Brevibacterium sp. Marseille-P9724]|uniref:GAF domain-containing protein n=1 Tax=Brevibacterium sp. Marseille-P9724 TaxID=2614125 RepID=UPI00125EB271|nr:GAF domain-containing protein [Brevibacterium sp. Marseille-P9724]